jgi:hypothetical protein
MGLNVLKPLVLTSYKFPSQRYLRGDLNHHTHPVGHSQDIFGHMERSIGKPVLLRGSERALPMSRLEPQSAMEYNVL